MMSAMTLSVVAVIMGSGLPAPASDTVRLCVADAVTRAPVNGAVITVWRSTVSTTAETTIATPCALVVGDSASVHRVGYSARTVPILNNRREQTVWLIPVGAIPAVQALSPVVVVSDRDSNNTGAGRTTSTLRVTDARRSGAGSTSQLLERLAYANVRSARGETVVSLRGARREQVVFTFDGLSLNDPATGSADISDIPLAALGSATAVLGADPLGVGPGASGGVIALTSASQRVLSMRVGTLGERNAQGAWFAPFTGFVLHGAAMHEFARNNFSFVNTAGASDNRATEVRVNNDETRTSVLTGAIGPAWQLVAMGSWSERGMVGPVNVRTYDADRAFTNKFMARAQYAAHGVQFVGGTHTIDVAYRDPNRPVLNTSAHANATDVEVRGRLGNPPHVALTDSLVLSPLQVGWRAGGGFDQLRAAGGVTQQRNRLFLATQGVWQTLRMRSEFGVRLDAVQPRGGQPTLVQPSLALATEQHLVPHVTIAARAAQAVRVPTLYDLYFSSPQRLSIAPLNVERVRADLELSARTLATTPMGTVNVNVAVVRRETRDAIVWFPGNFGWSPRNVGIEMLNGIDGRIALSSAPITVSAWFTAYDTHLTIGDLHIPSPYVPQLAAGSQVVFRSPIGDVSALTHTMGRRPFTAGPANPDFELPAVTLVDMAITKDVAPTLLPSTWNASVTLTVDNATNVAWQSVRGFPSPGRTWALSLTLQPTQSK